MSKAPPLLSKDEMQEAAARLQTYLRDEMEIEVGRLRAGELGEERVAGRGLPEELTMITAPNSPSARAAVRTIP